MQIEDKFEAVDRFRTNLTNTFIDLCRGNDYNKLTLLKIGDTIDRTYDKLIDDMRNDEGVCYRKQSEDTVEVVMCKDCIHYLPYQKPVEDFDGRCTACRGDTDEDEFCSRGVRREQK